VQECENCQQALVGSELTVPWEDGDNAEAYVVCRHCRHRNTVYGFGEDD
jgi:DNA-directed RNA polymerase subunit RPC12/RpoP